jgi:hypothetical protein
MLTETGASEEEDAQSGFSPISATGSDERPAAMSDQQPG